MSSIEQVDKKSKDAKNLEDYRLESFTRMLGEDWALADIVALVESDVPVADLRNLLESGCPKGTAVRILL